MIAQTVLPKGSYFLAAAAAALYMRNGESPSCSRAQLPDHPEKALRAAVASAF